MTSQRRRKRTAQQQGLTSAELELCSLLREVLEALRWSQVLGWGNQYLLSQHVQVSAEERDRVMRAAAATVERDGSMQQWQRRLQEIEQRLAAIDRTLRAPTGGSAANDAGDGGRGADARRDAVAGGEAGDAG